jgi:hypothetical protein
MNWTEAIMPFTPEAVTCDKTNVRQQKQWKYNVGMNIL